MDSIRTQIAADALLQAEISRGLIAVADSLLQGGDQRVARILTRILETSWSEHVSFQDLVVFPILIGRREPRIAAAIEQQQSEHARLSQQHCDLARQLEGLLAEASVDTAGLEALLRSTCALRRSHLNVDEQLDGWLPASLSGEEMALCGMWAAQRPAPRFPLNLLNIRRRAHRLAGHLH
jgi:hypothetical protein